MSKKKIYNKHLEKGRFYLHNDKHGGHPALLHKKRDKNNMYFIIIFTSFFGPKRTKLKHSIEPAKVKISFVHNSPTIEKYEDFSSPYPLDNLRVHKDDLKLVRKIQKKKR